LHPPEALRANRKGVATPSGRSSYSTKGWIEKIVVNKKRNKVK